jgi:putative transposase
MGRRGRASLTSETEYFVTTTVTNFAKVFVETKYCDIFVANIRHYQEIYQFKIYGYVIMPTHFHWIVQIEPNRGTISDIMRDIKKFTAWDVMEALEHDGRDALLRLFKQKAVGLQQRRKFWMSRFDDEFIRNREMILTKLEYIHNNPLKAGLAVNQEDYKYSSARNYILRDHSILQVETDW